MMGPSRERGEQRDSGFTLVELVISMALISVVILTIGGVLISSLRAEQTVRSVTTSTTDGQLVLLLIESGVRNASALSVSTAVDESSFLVVRTLAGGTPRCRAWFFDPTVSTIFERQQNSAISRPTAGSVDSGWTPISGSILTDDASVGGPFPVFASVGTQAVTIRFMVTASVGPGTLFVSTITGRAPSSNVSPQCF